MTMLGISVMAGSPRSRTALATSRSATAFDASYGPNDFPAGLSSRITTPGVTPIPDMLLVKRKRGTAARRDSSTR